MKPIPEIIPPRSVVELVRTDRAAAGWRPNLGRRFRIGYYSYSRNDGLDTIWLVNDAGEYEQTTDRGFLLKYFKIVKLSGEKDFFGKNRRRLPRLRSSSHVAS
ncbi:MAG TPA: hypothetical protein VGQ99_18540 [Tepidisphaeraceae bacterium]|jgi:hypothetical protein|nr:hypothetical protein [Tepidisphaeraceae bacterium]